MKNRTLAILFVAIFMAVTAATVSAAVPQQLAWQGVAIDEDGNPLAAGLYTFHFAIYSADVGGDSLWGESQTVPVENGVLNVLLGTSVPIPDSAFAGEGRYLQVQFESQAPYVPRTKIVSVGYAFRASSVDGAAGGTITSAVQVEESVTTPEVVISPVPASGAAAASAVGQAVVLDAISDGGMATFLDEVGQSTVVMGPDPDGQGGLIAVSGDPSRPELGILLDGNGLGTLNPELSIVGDNSALSFDMNLIGDEAVSFPVDAISAPEIKDEPGVASGAQAGAIYDVRESYQSLAAATATFPNAGFAMVLVQATFRAHEGNTWVSGRLLQNGVAVEEWNWDPGDPDQYFDERQSYFTVLPVDAGTDTYELRVRTNKGSSDVEAAKVLVIYLPTSYGAIAGVSSPGAEGPVPDLQPLPAASAPLNVTATETESVAVNQQRIEEEVSAMEARLVILQAELKKARALLEGE
jgi:hypothetical protein